MNTFAAERFTAYLQARGPVSPLEAETILVHALHRSIKRKTVLLAPGEHSRHYYFVIKGSMRLYRLADDGNEHVLRFALEDWWMSDQESIDGGHPSHCFIESLEPCELLAWNVEDWNSLKEQLPALKALTEKLQARQIAANHARIYQAISATADERYRTFIRTYPDIFKRVPVYQIASYLGVSRKTLTRIRMQETRTNSSGNL